MMKKTLGAVTAAVTAVLLAGGVYAADSFRTSDAVRLQSSLHSTQGGLADYDLDGSGEVDVLDLGLMKHGLAQDTGTVTAQTFPATADYAKLQSRCVIRDGITWLVQSGSAVESYITADTAKLTLAGSSGISNGEDYRPRYGIWVDGELLTDALMNEKTTEITLWEGEKRTALVQVMLLSEAMYGGVGVQSIDVESSAAFPVKPVPARDLRIEFIGDSITCAYGVEGASQGDQFKTSTENFSKSYAYLAARQLGADYATCCYSGHGIVSGYSSDGKKNADSLIPDCYGQSSKFADYGTDWDFSSVNNDAVVINLGTNDINYVAAEPETRGPEFVEAYKAFLATVRQQNPHAAIVCTVGTMGGDEVYTLIEQAVREYKAETSETNVIAYFSKTHSMADGLGSDWHPSAQTQQNSAYVMADKICQAIGIPSAQIGVDVAAEADYDMVTSGTANAAHYVGYDKSFWINTVSGGDSTADIEAVLSGIGLQKNGKYVLSFDVTAGVEREFPVVIRGSRLYYTGTVTAGPSSAHFEEELVIDTADSAAEIAFQVGGVDSSNVTLNNIRLTKIG